MMCLQDMGNGTFTILDPQPISYTECLFVMGAPTEIQQSPFNLSVADASQLSAAIAVVWAIAYAGRLSTKALKVDETEKE